MSFGVIISTPGLSPSHERKTFSVCSRRADTWNRSRWLDRTVRSSGSTPLPARNAPPQRTDLRLLGLRERRKAARHCNVQSSLRGRIRPSPPCALVDVGKGDRRRKQASRAPTRPADNLHDLRRALALHALPAARLLVSARFYLALIHNASGAAARTPSGPDGVAKACVNALCVLPSIGG